MSTPNLQLPEVPQAILDASDELNQGFSTLDVVVQLAVIDKDLTIPPADALQGDRYIVPENALGVWSGRAKHIAAKFADGWRFVVPRPGFRARVLDENLWYIYTGLAWIEDVGGGGGASIPDGSPLVLHHTSFGANSTGWPGYTLIMRMRGRRLLIAAEKWRFRIEITAGTMNVVGMVVRRTLSFSLTYIDSVPVTIAGLSAPSLGVGVHESDDIEVPLDIDHDFFVLIYINASTSGSAAFKMGNDAGAESGAGSHLGDHRADSSMGASVGNGTAFGNPLFITAS